MKQFKETKFYDVAHVTIEKCSDCGRRLSERVREFTRSICDKANNSKAVKALYREEEAFAKSASNAAEKAKAFGAVATTAAKVNNLIERLRDKVGGVRQKMAAKHPKFSKVIGKIVRIAAIGGAALLVGRMGLVLISIFPEVLSLVLTTAAMIIGVNVVIAIFEKAFAL